MKEDRDMPKYLEGNQWQIGEDIAGCSKQKFKVTYAYLEGSSVFSTHETK